jgi:Ca-activated chloride channel family protein
LHEVEVEHPGGDKSRAVVRLAEKAVLPNRDFAISYRTAGDAISDAILTHTDERGNFFSMVIQPPARVKQEQVVPRELVFVLDTSGSMSGFPMETSKAMMRRAIENLRPEDRFNIVTFAGNTSVLFPDPVANNEQNRHKALRFIDTLQGAGGTEMMKAINMALGGKHDAKKVRIVCFLTDGYVGNDMAIIGAIKEHAETTRVFGFGIGSAVNRFLMDGMAKAGRGEAHYVMSHEQAKKSADKFYERIDAPVLTDIALDFGDIEVEEVYPKRVEDLFAAKPVVVKGRYKKPGAGVIKLKGVNAAGAFEREIPVTFGASNPENAVLASQWARAKVDDLMMNDMTGMQQGQVTDQLKQEIISLGIAYNLLTQFTSFVAVEELRITEGGKARTIRVPVEMPQGVSYAGVFGRGAGDGSGFGLARTANLSGGGAYQPAPAMEKSRASLADGDASSLDMREETALDRLENMPADGELKPADKRDKLLALKLDESLRKLAATGDTKPVEVRVTLRDFSADAIAKLEALGFKLLAKATSVKLIIGTIPADKLEELALLKVVRSIEPGTP